MDLDERVVHRDHFGVCMREGVAEHDPADTAKAVDTNFSGHLL